MSALTNLFTALANKIRSKTGGSDTYTPSQMVNAIDDVYDAGVAAGTTPTQTKTVTATTSAQTVTPDSGYALSSVTVNPQSHSGYYPSAATNITTNGTKDLGDNHNYRYVNVDVPSPTVYPITPNNSIPEAMSTNRVYEPTTAGYAIESYTAIEPSNSSPVSLSNHQVYTMEGSGYAISSYSSATPSNSSPASLSSGSIYKMSAAGYAISSYSSVTPSNSSPASLSSGSIYKASAAGYAISSYSSVTPSNSSPASLSSGSIYKASAAGYAISSYSSVTPSSSGTYFASGMIKMSSSGYAYSTNPSGGMDFFDTLYATSGQQTYTFTQDLSLVYVCCPTNSTSNRGTYTGSGSKSSVDTGTYQIIDKITNVKSGDTFKAPSFAVSGTNRTLLFFVGQKA